MGNTSANDSKTVPKIAVHQTGSVHHFQEFGTPLFMDGKEVYIRVVPVGRWSASPSLCYFRHPHLALYPQLVLRPSLQVRSARMVNLPSFHEAFPVAGPLSVPRWPGWACQTVWGAPRGGVMPLSQTPTVTFRVCNFRAEVGGRHRLAATEFGLTCILFGIHVNRSGLAKFCARIGGSTGASFTEGNLRFNTH